ncbi:MAG: SDR family oxidoreductase [Alphaproteobacteria bacterium]|nr:SDR family oxidoreductase [Alphaproteobacteria bacterium]MBU1516591.1 SDR family oxidoreductase [Alphaproteobacteria bacterium]MBU2094348.1 SDR family oxidoreductase [Alphaproteobacteria bacterium]MBU2153232.1 SDR family oxidoreductase [Alphaproteobacteria bacterium]MBU2307518.1 SDR family oxidoreductase [Alphaproteobacteria bacterium]
MRLLNKVAVITGGNSGIGFATARAFVAEGAQVVLVGRRADAVERAVAELGELATGVVGDVARLETHDAVAAFVAERFGAADIYVANAGTIQIQQSADVSPDDYDGQFLANARGTFFGVQKIMPLLRDGGAILLTSSIASRKVLDGHTVYAGSKAAIEAFARNWALEVKARRIRVNVLSPGPTDTPIIGKLGVDGDARPAFEAEIARVIPFGRLAGAEELARAAVFLASDDSAFVTGINLAVDGGATLA